MGTNGLDDLAASGLQLGTINAADQLLKTGPQLRDTDPIGLMNDIEKSVTGEVARQ